MSDPMGWEWVKNGNDFLWVSEKDGWRHIYLVSRDGKKETLLTNGDYDIETIKGMTIKTAMYILWLRQIMQHNYISIV